MTAKKKKAVRAKKASPILALKNTGKVQKTKVKSSKRSPDASKKSTSHTLNASKVTQGVSELLRIEKEHEEKSKALFDSEGGPVFMTVSAIRIANMPTRILRFMLPHTLLQETSDVALIVRDLEPRKRRPDNDAVVQLYESRLVEQGVKHPIKVMPIRQIMTEYNTYEAKRQLCNQFNVILADAHIVGRLTPILGKACRVRKKNPIPVKVDEPAQMKRTIERALNKTGMRLSAEGGTATVQVGHTQMTPKQISENIMHVVEELCKSFPGGWLNIRNIIIKTAKSPGIPLYVSIREPNEIQLTSSRLIPKHGQAVEGELSTAMDNIVRVYPSGRVVKILPDVKKKSKKQKKKLAKKLKQEKRDNHDEDDSGEEEDEMRDVTYDIDVDDLKEEKDAEVKDEKDSNESDSEDSDVEEAEEAYLAELSNTTSHLQKKKKTKKQPEAKKTKKAKKSK